MAFDECPPYPATREEVEGGNESHLPLVATLHQGSSRQDQALFGIVQGGVYSPICDRARRTFGNLDLPGYAIGGVSVGESGELIAEIVKVTAPLSAQINRVI